MKQKLLDQIKKISYWDYVNVLGLNYNNKQLKTYLSSLKN